MMGVFSLPVGLHLEAEKNEPQHNDSASHQRNQMRESVRRLAMELSEHSRSPMLFWFVKVSIVRALFLSLFWELLIYVLKILFRFEWLDDDVFDLVCSVSEGSSHFNNIY